MKSFKSIVIAAAAAILIPSYAHSADLGSVRTTLIERDAYIYTEDSGEWRALEANYPLWEGDSLWTAQSARVEIGVRGSTYVRMDSETLLEVLEIEDDYLRLFMEDGRLYVNNERGLYDYVQADSDYSSVRVPKGAIVMYDVAGSGAASISVLRGYAHVQSTSGSVRVNSGSTVHVGYDLFADLTPLGKADEWELWNRDRDDRIGRVYASTRYLPDELHEYAYDYDTYGDWVYVREYGHVWRPTLSVSISIGWAPYRHGHWRWRHGHYVWVSYEPWGWGPYHYGRWVHISRVGWCWVPPARGAVYWGPGYVGWVYTSSYVAWVPLAPYEIYYGYGYYGPYSVNIIDIDINKTVIKNVYVNSGVKGSVTTVHRDTFLTGKEKPVKPEKPPKELFASAKRGVGPPPDFRPGKEGKPQPRDMDVYKPRAARERTERKPAPPGEIGPSGRPFAGPETPKKEREVKRPSPPGRAVERRAPEPRVSPERQAPSGRPSERVSPQERRESAEPPGRVRPERQAPSGRPSERVRPQERRESAEPPGRVRPERQAPAGRPSERVGPQERRESAEPPGRVTEPERRTPSREVERPQPATPAPQRGGERVTPQRERGPVTAPPAERAPGRTETAPPGRVETPSPPGRTRDTAPAPSAAPERRSAPSSQPGWVDTPSPARTREAPRPSVTPSGKSAPATPSRPSKPESPPSRPEVKEAPPAEDAGAAPETRGTEKPRPSRGKGR